MSGSVLGVVSTAAQTAPHKSTQGNRAENEPDGAAFRQQFSAQRASEGRSSQQQDATDADQPVSGDAPAAEGSAEIRGMDERSLTWARPEVRQRAIDVEAATDEATVVAAVAAPVLTDELRPTVAANLPAPAGAGRELPRWQALPAKSAAGPSLPAAQSISVSAAQAELQAEAGAEIKAPGFGELKPEMGLQLMPSRPVLQIQAQDSPLAGMTRALAEPAVATERLLQAVQNTASSVTDAMPTLDASGGSERLAQSAAQRLMWMAGERISRAELALNPPDLGPVDIQMELEGDQLRLQMAAATGAAKELLDAALPRLRDQLAAAGLELVQAEVSYRQGRESGSDGTPADHRAGDRAAGANAAEESSERKRPVQSRRVSLLDQYA